MIEAKQNDQLFSQVVDKMSNILSFSPENIISFVRGNCYPLDKINNVIFQVQNKLINIIPPDNQLDSVSDSTFMFSDVNEVIEKFDPEYMLGFGEMSSAAQTIKKFFNFSDEEMAALAFEEQKDLKSGWLFNY